MATYAQGKYAVALCQICSLPFPYGDLREDGEVKGLQVCAECWSPRHPQERPAKPIDPIALRRPSPDIVKDPSYTMTYPYFDVQTGLYFGANLARFAVGLPATFYDVIPTFDMTGLLWDSSNFTWDELT